MVCKKDAWDQIISTPVTQSGPRGSVMTLGTPDTMTRNLVCNSHLALERLVELENGVKCVADMSGDALRSWELAVIRMLPEGINEHFVEHSNLVWSAIPVGSGAGWTRTELDSASSLRTGKLFRYYRITNNSADSFAVSWMSWNVIETTYKHDTVVRIRKSVTHSRGGSVRVRIQNAAWAVAYVTTSVSIPTDDSVVDVVYNGPAGGPFGAHVFWDNLGIGEQLEFAVACLVVS